MDVNTEYYYKIICNAAVLVLTAHRPVHKMQKDS